MLLSAFDVCWNCGTDRSGEPDPTFQPVQADPRERRCSGCGYSLVGLETVEADILAAKAGRIACPECGESYDPRDFELRRRGSDY